MMAQKNIQRWSRNLLAWHIWAAYGVGYLALMLVIFAYLVPKGAHYWIKDAVGIWTTMSIVLSIQTALYFERRLYGKERFWVYDFQMRMISLIPWLLVVGFPLGTGLILTIQAYPQTLRSGNFIPDGYDPEARKTAALDALYSFRVNSWAPYGVDLRLADDAVVVGNTARIYVKSERNGYLTMFSTSPNHSGSLVIGLENQPVAASKGAHFEARMPISTTHQATSRLHILAVVTSVPVGWGPIAETGPGDEKMSAPPKRMLVMPFRHTSDVASHFWCVRSNDDSSTGSAPATVDSSRRSACETAARDYAVSDVVRIERGR
ncbi:hypothetical protein [Massilia glaciei]|uniref:hypothetical protein n=1 Tax=Massilia glaciei TaxID=1524097 RepID=UPI0011B226E1|nr:hypothetical protein [Massilia glaciei]